MIKIDGGPTHSEIVETILQAVAIFISALPVIG
jgi:hypothetical protein